jgi:hypothetical protein
MDHLAEMPAVVWIAGACGLVSSLALVALAVGVRWLGVGIAPDRVAVITNARWLGGSARARTGGVELPFPGREIRLIARTPIRIDRERRIGGEGRRLVSTAVFRLVEAPGPRLLVRMLERPDEFEPPALEPVVARELEEALDGLAAGDPSPRDFDAAVQNCEDELRRILDDAGIELLYVDIHLRRRGGAR